jgi:hypothetical protein
MADKVIVSKSKITALANSIRAKAGTTGAMNFDTMKTVVDGLAVSDNYTLQMLVNNRGNCISLFQGYTGSTNMDFIKDLNISNADSLTGMFQDCLSIKTIPSLDTSNATSTSNMFNYCLSLISIPELNTSKVITMHGMFQNCWELTTITKLDMNSVTTTSYMFSNCKKLTNLVLLNIKVNLQVGSDTSWGHLLTLDSLIGLCKECVYVGEARTLTIGSANLDKLAGKVFLKFKDPSVGEVALGEKGDVELCEASTTSSFGITDYMAMKNWTLA